MKTIAIEIDVEGDSCKGCVHCTPLTEIKHDSWNYSCDVFGEDLGNILWGKFPKRLPACIEAEQLHKDAVTAAKALIELGMNHGVTLHEIQVASRILKRGGG